jgi:hypothetical protein
MYKTAFPQPAKVAVVLGGRTLMVKPHLAKLVAERQAAQSRKWARFLANDPTVARLANGPSFSGTLHSWQSCPAIESRVRQYA